MQNLNSHQLIACIISQNNIFIKLFRSLLKSGIISSLKIRTRLYMSTLIKFTDNAAAKVKFLIEEEGNPNLKLRVYITGGGCSGFQYGFTFDENKNEDDTEVQNQAVSLLIDPMSFQYLVGAEIDYKSDVNGEQFIIRNPNAKTTCGCGSSFAV